MAPIEHVRGSPMIHDLKFICIKQLIQLNNYKTFFSHYYKISI